MNLDISLILPGQVSVAIPALMPYLEESAAQSRGRSRVDDIVRFILNGQMQLWVVFDPEGQKVMGHIITEIFQYPGFKMLRVQYCCIEFHHFQYVLPKVQEYAPKFCKDTGCMGIEFFGRPGWEKLLKDDGYKAEQVIFTKYFPVTK
jgi:hypothetical protein